MGAEAVQTLSWDSSPATGWTFSLRGSGTAGLSPATSMEESMWGHWLRGLQGDCLTCCFQLVLQWSQPDPGTAAAPLPTQRTRGLPHPAQREQPPGLLTVRYLGRPLLPLSPTRPVLLTLGWLVSRRCWVLNHTWCH